MNIEWNPTLIWLSMSRQSMKRYNIIFARFVMNENQKFLVLRATLSDLWQRLLDHFRGHLDHIKYILN